MEQRSKGKLGVGKILKVYNRYIYFKARNMAPVLVTDVTKKTLSEEGPNLKLLIPG